jgi:hypothetical protein
MGLRRCDAQNRTVWRNGVLGKFLISSSVEVHSEVARKAAAVLFVDRC